jgi:hypothetical protein
MTDSEGAADAERAHRINEHAGALLDLLSDVKPGLEPFYVCGFVQELLAKFGMIGCIWSIEDVQGIRSDLSDEQAWQVLEAVARRHDANYGVSWATVESLAEVLFGDAPETDDAEEENP